MLSEVESFDASEAAQYIDAYHKENLSQLSEIENLKKQVTEELQKKNDAEVRNTHLAKEIEDAQKALRETEDKMIGFKGQADSLYRKLKQRDIEIKNLVFQKQCQESKIILLEKQGKVVMKQLDVSLS